MRFHFRYMEGNHNSQIISNLACPPPYLSNQKLHSITAMKSSNDSSFDMFAMMKENALFLLELSSTNSRKWGQSLNTEIEIEMILFDQFRSR